MTKNADDELPDGMDDESLRRQWEKWLISRNPAEHGADDEEPEASDEDEVETPAPKARKVPRITSAGEMPSDLSDEEALKQGAVLFFEDENFGGTQWVAPPGRYKGVSEAGIRNDAVSSIKLGKGVKLTMWEDADFKGNSRSITGDVSNVGREWNDKMTSFKVERV